MNISMNSRKDSSENNLYPAVKGATPALSFLKEEVPVADGEDPIIYSELQGILEELRMGRLVLVTDDPARENEADLICAGQFATPQNINFMATYGRGLICVPMAPERVDALGLPMQVQHNTEKL